MHSKCDKMSLELVRNWLPARHVLTTVVLEADDEVSHVVSLLLVGVFFFVFAIPKGSSISSKSKMASSWATVLLFISLARVCVRSAARQSLSLGGSRSSYTQSRQSCSLTWAFFRTSTTSLGTSIPSSSSSSTSAPAVCAPEMRRNAL